MTDEKYRGSGSDPLSKRILNSIKPFSGEHTSKWLAALSTDTVKDSVVINGGGENAQEPPRSMAAWVDNLFDHFQRYAFDFSRMSNDADLQVSCTRPTVQESKSSGPETSVVTTGWLSTTQWALVVRGEFFKIQVYVLPAGMLMGFRARHEEFPLYMEMFANQAGRNKIKWTLDGQSVSMDQSPAIAKKLFAHLVMVARGEAKETDKFSFNQPGAKEEFANLPGLPQRPSSFDQDLGLLKPEWLVEERPNQAPVQQSPVHQAPVHQAPVHQAPMHQAPMQQAPMQQVPMHQSPTQQSTIQPSPIQQAQISRASLAAGAPPQNAVTSEAQKLLSMQDLLQQNLVLVLNECNQFAGALDEQLEMLTPIGVKAIQNQDMSTASEIMQRAKRLKALLDAVVTFRNDWKDNAKKPD